MKRIIVSLVILILLLPMIMAEVPAPPPTPDFGDDSSSGSGSGGGSYNSDDLPPPPSFDFGDDKGDDNTNSDIPDIPPPPNVGGLAANQEEPKEPNLECPTKTSGWTVFLFILDILLIGVIVFLIIYLMKKNEQKPVVTQTTEKKGFSDDIIYDGLEPVREYIRECRSQGFEDDKIKVQLLKNGYDVQIVNKLF
ncbi:MAG: hypothetical protein ABH828_04045 [archaeon]